MNITFLIGNGFDLRIGMKTRFADMYDGYIVQPSLSDSVNMFKEMLKADAPKYKTWGDFEMAMAKKAKVFESESAFIECLRDFKLYMVSHLEEEQAYFKQRVSVSSDARGFCTNEVWNSIENFFGGFVPNVRNAFAKMGGGYRPNYHFISFNYTTVFDDLLSPNPDVIHIHGSLGADVVLGADNLDQLEELPYMTTRRIERAFIKPEFNKAFDTDRLTRASDVIDSSDIICAYGLSLGKSDYSWVAKLKNWLLSDKNHHLVYFIYDNTPYSRSNWDAIIDEEEDRVATLLGRICDSGEEMNQIFNQVHIPVGYDIFGIDEILKSEKIKADEDNKKKEELLKHLKGRHQEGLAIIG